MDQLQPIKTDQVHSMYRLQRIKTDQVHAMDQLQHIKTDMKPDAPSAYSPQYQLGDFCADLGLLEL